VIYEVDDDGQVVPVLHLGIAGTFTGSLGGPARAQGIQASTPRCTRSIERPRVTDLPIWTLGT